MASIAASGGFISFNPSNMIFTINGTTGIVSGGTGASKEAEFGLIAFAAGVVTGARSFKVDKLGRLTGIHYPQVWKPGENLAECRAEGQVKKAHPITTCAHGFYAYYDGSDDYHSDGLVSGIVEGYGESVIGSRGFRVMKARIVALKVSKDLAKPVASLVARNYKDVPQFSSFEAMVKAFPPDSAGAEPAPETDEDFWTRSI